MTSPLASVLAGLLVGFGVWLAIIALSGRSVLPASLPRLASGSRRQLAIALAAAVVAMLITEVAVVGVIAGTVGWVVAGGRRVGFVDQVDTGAAIASWTETVRDLLGAGQPLNSALQLSAGLAPTVLVEPLAELAGRVDAGWSLPDALAGFRDRLAHPTADRVVVALTLAHTHGVGDLRALLTAQIESLRDEVQLLRDVHAGRANIRRTVQLLLGLFAVVAVAAMIVFRSWFAFYRTAPGQVALAGIAAVTGAGVLSLQRLTRLALPPRFYGGGDAQ